MVERVEHCTKKAQNQSIMTLSQRNIDTSDPSMHRDQTLHLGNGLKLNVKGTKHVYKAIMAGTAMLTMCTACGVVS